MTCIRLGRSKVQSCEVSIKDSSKLFCGNVNDSVCEADVAELFRYYGFEAEDVALPTDPQTGPGFSADILRISKHPACSQHSECTVLPAKKLISGSTREREGYTA